MKQTFFLILIIAVFLGCKDSNSSNLKNKNGNEMSDTLNVDKDSVLVAVIETTMGKIEIELFPQYTPKTVENFVGLINKGYYNGVIFHRVINNFMIQTGDPTGTGRGGQSFWGGKFADEFSGALTHDSAGIVSMANSGPNTNGSQFFITLEATNWLDGKHSVFGKVIDGIDVVNAIGRVETVKPSDRPVKDVVMQKVSVEKRKR
jgi:peptidyl-prolyl cis-trans isomerase-like 1